MLYILSFIFNCSDQLKNTVKMVILWNIITILNVKLFSILIYFKMY